MPLELCISLCLLVLIIMDTDSTTGNFVIKNVKVVDGRGTPPYLGVVEITGSRIRFVGTDFQEPACQTSGHQIIDGHGAFIAPGFIDSHTHDDVYILSQPHNPAKLLQGVTTIATGNCGFSNYPNGHLPNVQEHLSTLLGDVNPDHLFENFKDYANFMRQNGLGPNVASLVGHGPIRLSVVGADNRLATPREIRLMSQLLQEQFHQGSLGLSLGLVYPPSAYAGREELVALANIAAKNGKLVAGHIRSYEGNLIESIDEFLEILRLSKARGLLSHLQVAGVPYWGTLMPQALTKIQNAIDSGVDVQVDMYPYLAGSSTILQILPPSAMAGGFEAFEARLESDPTYFYTLKHLTEHGAEPGWESKVALIGWTNIVINSVVNPNLEPIQGLSIPDGAAKWEFETDFEFFLHVVLEDNGRSNVIMFQQSAIDQKAVFQSSFQMVGSDSIPRAGGKPHPRMYGSFPNVLGQMAFAEQPLLTIEEAVRKCTSMAAGRLGISDRGVIQPGMAADLVMFTEDVIDTATYDNPESHPRGIVAVWVNGVQVVRNGTVLTKLAGTVV